MSDWQAGLVVLGGVAALWGLMYLGWRSRARRQAGVPAPATAPGENGLGEPLLADIPGTYVSTVAHGRWADRIVAHGLGAPSEVVVSAGTAGVWLRRSGAPDVFLPTGEIVEVGRTRGQAGKYTLEEGLVVITWRREDQEFDTAFRPKDWADIASVDAALHRLVPQQAA